MAQCVRDVTTDRYDVCVVGAGMAGICAAVAAAREGATTALVDDRPVLGGCSSSEIRIPICGAGYHNPWATESGIIHELVVEDRARNHAPVSYGQANAIWDMVLYDACRAETNLTLHLNTCIDRVEMDGTRIASVSGTQSHSGLRLTIPARMFIDCSGDGVVGVGAGVPWRVGPEARVEYGESMAPEAPDDFVLGSTLVFRALDTGHEVPFEAPEWAVRYDSETIPYRSTSDISGGYWWIELGWPLDTLHDDAAIRDELLRHVFGVWDHIKNHSRQREQARTWALDWVGFLPARRESRRLVGAHVLTQDEIQRAEQFADTVAVGGWSIDDHTRGGIAAVDKRPSFDSVRLVDYLVTPFPVPLRSLHAAEVPNLFCAGRCMSASRVAFLSLRVQQTLATTGQAAGTAAAWCVANDRAPQEITDAAALQQRLLRRDAWLPNVEERDLAQTAGATAVASSEATLHVEPGEGGPALSCAPAAMLPLSADRLESVSLCLDNEASEAEATVRLYAARDLWDLDALEGEPLAEARVTIPGGSGWTDVPLNVAIESGMHWLRVEGSEAVTWCFAAEMQPGTCSSERRPDGTRWFAGDGWKGWHSLALRVSPESRPFGAGQVLTGHARSGSSANLWISDPAEALPQWLEVRLPEATLLDTIALVFDTNLCRTNMMTPGLCRAPECGRDYTVEAQVGGCWQELARVADNYHRRREHGFDAIEATGVRVTVTATNGDRSARIYAIRLYHDGH